MIDFFKIAEFDGIVDGNFSDKKIEVFSGKDYYMVRISIRKNLGGKYKIQSLDIVYNSEQLFKYFGEYKTFSSIQILNRLGLNKL